MQPPHETDIHFVFPRDRTMQSFLGYLTCQKNLFLLDICQYMHLYLIHVLWAAAVTPVTTIVTNTATSP